MIGDLVGEDIMIEGTEEVEEVALMMEVAEVDTMMEAGVDIVIGVVEVVDSVIEVDITTIEVGVVDMGIEEDTTGEDSTTIEVVEEATIMTEAVEEDSIPEVASIPEEDSTMIEVAEVALVIGEEEVDSVIKVDLTKVEGQMIDLTVMRVILEEAKEQSLGMNHSQLMYVVMICCS